MDEDVCAPSNPPPKVPRSRNAKILLWVAAGLAAFAGLLVVAVVLFVIAISNARMGNK